MYNIYVMEKYLKPSVCVISEKKEKSFLKRKRGIYYEEYVESLTCTINEYIRSGYCCFVTDISNRVSIDFAETVLYLKGYYNFEIKLSCVITNKKIISKKLLNECNQIVNLADNVVSVEFGNGDYIKFAHDYLLKNVDKVLCVVSKKQTKTIKSIIKTATDSGKSIDIIYI